MNTKSGKPSTSSGMEESNWISDAINEYENALVRYALHFTLDGERARDIVQDTFLQLCKQSPEKRDREIRPILKNWLFKVCRNRAIDVGRKEKRMKVKPSDELADDVAHANREKTSGMSPDSGMMAEENAHSLSSQIGKLPDKQQEVLKLKYHGGLSYKEIAEVTGLTISHVGNLLHRAIASLRQKIAVD